MDDFDALLDAAVERKTLKPNTAIANVTLGGKPVTLKFTELDAREWARCTIAHPPQPEIQMDSWVGYSLAAAAEHAAPLSGVRVDGEVEHSLTAEQWVKLFKGVDGNGISAIADAIFEVNEHAQIERVLAAKKALEVAASKKRRLPAK